MIRSCTVRRCGAAFADLGRQVFTGAGLIVLVATALYGQPSSREGEITQFLGGFMAAWNNADARGLAAMFAPNATLHTPSGHADSRTEIETLLKRQETELFNGHQLSVHLREIRFNSPHDVEVETDFLLDGYSAMGVGSAPPGSLSFMLRKDDGPWRIQQAVMQR